MTLDVSRWERRLSELAGAHEVPGASLAVLADGDVHRAAAGVLNVDTGMDATPDSLFQIGSITKSYTATVVMRLVEQGKLDLDAPVTDVLPEFRVADPEVTRRVTPRHLLSHTSGIAGESFEDTGRGDDALERYVASCAELGQDVPLGVTMSYCNTGYSVLGRIVERLTGQVWDAAMRELLFEPLGLTQTRTLPEDVLRFRAAWGHTREPGHPLELVPAWDVPRSLGPAGGIWATAADVLRFARLHLEGGRAPDGGQILSEDGVARMREVQVDVPDRWTTGGHWGLGWILEDWEGRRLFGHDGNTTGQAACLRVVPDHDVAICLLTNGGDAHALWVELCGGLVWELCGIAMPPFPQPGPASAAANGQRIVGRYERHGIRVEIESREGALHATTTVLEPLASQLPEEDRSTTTTVRSSTAGADVYVSRAEDEDTWWPLVVFEVGGERYLHAGARAQRKVG